MKLLIPINMLIVAFFVAVSGCQEALTPTEPLAATDSTETNSRHADSASPITNVAADADSKEPKSDELGTKKNVDSTDNSSPKESQRIPDRDDLMQAFVELQDAIRAKDTGKALELTHRFMPDESSLQQAVKDPAVITKVMEMHARYTKAPDDRVALLFATDAARTKINVHAATTEQIAAYKEGSPAYDEFPGGAKEAANTVLQPGMTFYEVELVEPGKVRGMKYHLFFFDGKNWKMLGAVWRVLGP